MVATRKAKPQNSSPRLEGSQFSRTAISKAKESKLHTNEKHQDPMRNNTCSNNKNKGNRKARRSNVILDVSERVLLMRLALQSVDFE